MKKILYITLLLIAYTFLMYVVLVFGNATFDMKEMNSDSRMAGALFLFCGYIMIPIFYNIIEE